MNNYDKHTANYDKLFDRYRECFERKLEYVGLCATLAFHLEALLKKTNYENASACEALEAYKKVKEELKAKVKNSRKLIDEKKLLNTHKEIIQ